MKFRYKKFSKDVLRPIIPVVIEHDGNSVGYQVLVDSGSDSCIFDADLCEILGVDLERGERHDVSGISGQPEPYYVHDVTLWVGGRPCETRVGFKMDMGRFGHGVVGQKGFFDRFVVKFDLSKEEIELKERA